MAEAVPLPIQYVTLKDELAKGLKEYPFDIPLIKKFRKITFHSPVTFIIGENGTGKSTLLEAIAVAYGFNPEGGSRNFNFQTRETHSELYKYLRIGKSYNAARDGYFIRGESFYNVASDIDRLAEEDDPPAVQFLRRKIFARTVPRRKFFIAVE